MRISTLFAAISFAAAPLTVQAAEPVPTLSLSATGTAIVVPDMAQLSLMVVREAPTAREALDANTLAMTEVIAAMKDAGLADRDIQTSQFSIQPQYRHFRPNKEGEVKPPEITGYRVTNGLTLRVRDLDNVGTILDRSVTLGVNQGGNIQFSTSQPEAALQRARKNAVEKALAKARTLTEAAGVGLGRVVSMSEQGGRQPRMRQVAKMARMEMAADAAPVPIAAGEGSYSITVSMSWELDQ